MNLYIKQRLFSFINEFDVLDENQIPVYYVKRRFFTLTLDLSIIDYKTGNEVAFIRREIFRLLPRFIISRPGFEDVTIKKEFTIFSPSYEIIGTPWRLEGDFFAHDYQILTDNHHTIMRLSKRWFTWADTYELAIASSEDAVLALCISLCVDAVLSDQRSASASSSN